jgi:hypothetical protein
MKRRRPTKRSLGVIPPAPWFITKIESKNPIFKAAERNFKKTWNEKEPGRWLDRRL